MMTPATNRAYNPHARPTPSSEAAIREQAARKAARFHLGGHVTEHSARLTRQRVLDELLEGQRSIIIDLGQAVGFDSGALGILVSITRRVQEAKGELELDNVSEQTRVLFKLMHLETIFTIREPARTGAGRRTPSSTSVIPLNKRVG
jgi:anti-anti-sigma factor